MQTILTTPRSAVLWEGQSHRDGRKGLSVTGRALAVMQALGAEAMLQESRAVMETVAKGAIRIYTTYDPAFLRDFFG